MKQQNYEIYTFKRNRKTRSCRVWFGTVDDGDFGSWNDFETKEEALNLLGKVVKKFEDITRLPSSEELNVMFRELGVYFCFE